MVGTILTLAAARAPDAPALVFGDVRLSYAELNARARRFANGLARLGLARGDRVAVLLANSTPYVEAFFGAAKIGALMVPVNFRLATPEIRWILEDCTPAALVYGTEFGDILAPLVGTGALPARLVAVPTSTDVSPVLPGALGYDAWISQAPATEPEVEVATTDDQLIVYTSGTTGRPKGAVWTHGNTLFSALAKIIDFDLTPADRVVVFGPLFHVGPLMDLAVPLLQRGGTVVLGRSHGFDPTHLLAVLEAERATLVSIYPVMWRRVLAVPDLDRYALRSLRLLLTGGEPMPPPLLHEIYERFPNVPFVNTYGSTEGGPITTFLPPADRIARIGSIGKPAFHVEVRIVDDHDQEVPPGIVGELVVRSPVVCRGYWGRPEATLAARRGGWWHTGDLAYRDEDGFLWIAGRKHDMIISGAENVYPVEVEQVIAALDAVDEVAVAGVPDPAWGEAVTAFVVRKPGAVVTEAAILEHCRANLAGYKKPRRVVFVSELPRTSVNKVSREALRHRFDGTDTAPRPKRTVP